MHGPPMEIRPIRIRESGGFFYIPCPTPLWRVAQVVAASRPSRHGELPKSSRRVAQVVTASCPTRHNGLPNSEKPIRADILSLHYRKVIGIMTIFAQYNH